MLKLIISDGRLLEIENQTTVRNDDKTVELVTEVLMEGVDYEVQYWRDVEEGYNTYYGDDNPAQYDI